MVIELRVVQFWSEIILVISNQTRAARSFDFEITRMISDQIALHSVQLPLLMLNFAYIYSESRKLVMFILFQRWQFVYPNKINSPAIRQLPSFSIFGHVTCHVIIIKR